MRPTPTLRRPAARVIAAGLAAAVVGATFLGGSPTSASVAVDQSYPVPKDGTWTVRGHGYGHGNGMSQHGAQGAAQEGLNHRQILAFYYPGTEIGTARKRIRVLITADTSADVVVLPRSGLTLRDRGSGTAYPLPTGVDATRWRLTTDAQNRDIVEYDDGGWTRWRPGGRDTLEGEGQFEAGGKPITLVTPSGQRAYRGVLRAAKPSPGSTDRDTVNAVAMNHYLKGVVPREMPALWEPEAVQAQSVAARTYASWSVQDYLDRYYQICDTTSCQVYGGYGDEHPASNAAIAETGREILTYGGEPAFTQFSASSGGWTSAGSMPYLVSKQDPYDNWSGNTHRDWSVSLSASRVRSAFPGIGAIRRLRVTQREGGGEWKGRVETIVVVGAKGSRTVTGDTFRSTFGLKSTWFSFT